jgi:hypothetical protein
LFLLIDVTPLLPIFMRGLVHPHSTPTTTSQNTLSKSSVRTTCELSQYSYPVWMYLHSFCALCYSKEMNYQHLLSLAKACDLLWWRNSSMYTGNCSCLFLHTLLLKRKLKENFVESRIANIPAWWRTLFYGCLLFPMEMLLWTSRLKRFKPILCAVTTLKRENGLDFPHKKAELSLNKRVGIDKNTMNFHNKVIEQHQEALY